MINVLKNKEIPALRSKYAWVYETPKTKWKYTLGGGAITKIPVGQLKSEYHIKRINFLGTDKKWHKMEECFDFGRTWWRLKKPLGYDNLVPMDWLFSRVAQGIKVYLPSYYGRIKNPLKTEMPLLVNAADATYYPDPHTEETSVDGFAWQNYALGSGVDWATLKADAGNGFNDSNDYDACMEIKSDNVNSKWLNLTKGIFVFDASASSGNTILSGSFFLKGIAKADGLNISPTINVYSSAPASNTAIANGDFDSLGTTAYCDTAITYTNWDTAGYNTFTINTAGITFIQTAINGDGKIKFGTREPTYDVGISTPSWTSSVSTRFMTYLAETANTTSDPKLELVYSVTYGHADFQAATSTSGF